ncbi:MAG: anhydro-N-acetylmuramic acid kinase [Candidatus Planktophila sp.]|nr:anhydro-N-acetylmuramic acid kinase [Candidatus Planktophila sp.]
MKIMGMISGTSFDGMDIACCEFEQVGDTIEIKQVGFESVAYTSKLHQLIADSMPPREITMERVCVLDAQIGQEFSSAAEKVMKRFDFQPDLIVSHGQTLFHWIDAAHVARGTLQLGEPAWIAENTGVSVLSNIRSRDVAAGGHGAPLVSILDHLLFNASDHAEGALNLGGISNITVAGNELNSIAYDIGPANGLMDAAIFAFTNGEKSFDKDGELAAHGVVDTELLSKFLNEPYYALPAPKSTGKELFHLPYIVANAGEVETWNLPNLIATLLELTVETVSREVERFKLAKLYIAGGGSANPVLMNRLSQRLSNCEVLSMDALGIDPRAKEGLTFALIGFLSMNGHAGQVPSCTGARGERILGSLTPGKNGFSIPKRNLIKPVRVKII